MKRIYQLSLCFLLVYFASCEVLDVEPISVISATNFYQNAEHAEAAISAAYDDASHPVLVRDWISFTVLASDEAVNVPGTSGSRDRMNRHQYTAQRQANPRLMWSNTYNAMQKINDVILNVPGIEDPTLDADNLREELLGEAHFLRGLLYFFGTRYFGEMPIVLNVTNSIEPEAVNVSRDPIPEVFNQIISDLEIAIRDLPEEYETAEFTRGRATVGAAQALLAKVYLWRAWQDFGEGAADFQRAADLAQTVINSSLYSLVPGEDFSSIFVAGQQNTDESIFEFQVETQEVNGNQLQGEFQPGPIGRVRNVPSQKLLDAFAARPGDLRREITIVPVPEPEDNNGEPFYTGKHEQVVLDDPNVVMLRLADIILVRSEALNELGQTGEALVLLNQIRERAGIDPVNITDQAGLREAILEERFVELAFEGKRWHDLNRQGITVQEVEEISAENGNLHHVLWPVPQAEIDRNPNLTQNPGYGGGEGE